MFLSVNNVLYVDLFIFYFQSTLLHELEQRVSDTPEGTSTTKYVDEAISVEEGKVKIFSEHFLIKFVSLIFFSFNFLSNALLSQNFLLLLLLDNNKRNHQNPQLLKFLQRSSTLFLSLHLCFLQKRNLCLQAIIFHQDLIKIKFRKRRSHPHQIL